MPWIHWLSIASLLAGAVCAIVIALDVMRSPQKMAIMNLVWPITALFGSVVVAWAYFRYGVLSAKAAQRGAGPHPRFPLSVVSAKGALHCGSGCCLGDIVAEWLAFFFPSIALSFGWQSVFSEKVFAVWVFDFILAFLLGIVFQYFAIVPMRKLGFAQGVWAAVKADTLSLTAWQVGMYGFMAVAKFWIFGQLLGQALKVNSAEFWFMMQIAMGCGFLTSWPVNVWLIKRGLKEKM